MPSQDSTPASTGNSATDKQGETLPKEGKKQNHVSEGVMDFVDMWFGWAPPPPPKPKPANPRVQDPDQEPKRLTPSVFDVDGDGDVDMDDMVAAWDASVDGEAEESMLSEYRPIFALSQTVLCIALWVAGSIKATGGDITEIFETLGGLESFAPEDTKVFVHTDCTSHRTEVWRWITYQWTHANFSHVGMNSVLAVLFGIPLEGFHGHLRIVFIFNVGVVGGALGHMVSKTHESLVGMSAGCYALMGMRMADLIMNWHSNRWRKVYLAVLIFLICFDIAVAQLSSPDDPTGHSAHFGGYVAGLIMGVLFVRNLKVTISERILQGIMFVIGLALASFCIFWSAQWAPRTIWDPTPWCWARQMYDPTTFGDNEWHCIRCADQACIDSWEHISKTVKQNPFEQSIIASVNSKECDAKKLWWRT